MRLCAQCSADISGRHHNAKLCVACYETNRKKWHIEHGASQNVKRNARRAANPDKYKPAYERRKKRMAEIRKNSPALQAKQRDYRRLRKTGCSPELFQELLAKQAGLCAICKLEMATIARGACVDHDHKTGQIRGLLCSKCNSGIGQLQDSYEVVQAAAAYLAQYNSDHRNGSGLA